MQTRLRAAVASSRARPALVRAASLRYAKAARHVKPAAKFAAAALLGDETPRIYEIAGLRAALRGSDAEAIDEVFGREPYRLPDALRPRRILDLGANVGIYSLYALARYPDAKVIALEPDPRNAAALRRSMELNALDVEVREEAAGARNETVRFHARGTAGAVVSDDGDVEVRKVDVLPLLTRVDLAKIDIEGGEWEILTDPRFASHGPPVLVLEYHRYLCPQRSTDYLSPDPNPRRLVLDILTDAGYAVEEIEHHFWGHGTVRAERLGQMPDASASGPTNAEHSAFPPFVDTGLWFL